MAYGPDGRFALRSDPGTTIAIVDVAADGPSRVVARGRAPRTGHCLTVDGNGHVWTCDARAATVIRFTFP